MWMIAQFSLALLLKENFLPLVDLLRWKLIAWTFFHNIQGKPEIVFSHTSNSGIYRILF